MTQEILFKEILPESLFGVPPITELLSAFDHALRRCFTLPSVAAPAYPRGWKTWTVTLRHTLQVLQNIEKLCHAVYAVDQCICVSEHHIIAIPRPGLVLPRPTKPDLLAGIVIFLVIVFCLHKEERAYLAYNHDRYCSHFLVTGQQNFHFFPGCRLG